MGSATAAANQWLTANQSARVVDTTPENLQGVLPLIRVNSVGGTQAMTVASSRIAVECFAGTVGESDDLAQLVNQLLLWQFRGLIGTTTVTGVTAEQLPTWVPYPNPAVFMHTARYVVYNRDLATPRTAFTT